MKTFENTGLWRLLDDPASAATDAATTDTDAILQEFASHVTAYVHGDKHIDERCRSIEFEHGKLVAASKRPEFAESGGHLLPLVERAIAFLEREIEIAKMDLEHPGRFVCRDKAHHAPRAGWNGTQSELLELHTSLQLMGKILKPDTGEPMAYSDLIDFLKDTYGIDISQPYGRKTRLLTRSKGGAPFLELMLKIYLEKVEDIHK
jgi:hypothetical protein